MLNHFQKRIDTGVLNFGKPIFYSLIGLCALAACMYMYFIFGITVNIVARKSYEKNQEAMQTNISTLELSYLTKIQSLDQTAAASYGLVRPTEVYFASIDDQHVGFLTN